MAVWQRPARAALASFALTFAVYLLYHMSDRGAPTVAPAVVPTDPNAVLESRGARITLGDGSVITADRQFAYDDGSARLLGVEVIVPAGDDRTDFRIRSGEAGGVEESGEWRLVDTVTIETGDGLSGGTSEAIYADATGIVSMPQPARFEQGGLRLAGDTARYDRRRGLVHLDRRAIVELQSEADPAALGTRIAADAATVDRLAGVMRFAGSVSIDAGERRMYADTVVVRFDPDASRVDAIDLAGGARVLGADGAATDLREMAAQTIAVTYFDGSLERATLTGNARILGADAAAGQLRDLSAPAIELSYRNGTPERATMTKGARVELFGDRTGAQGLTIEGGLVDVALAADDAGVEELQARESVRLEFPAIEGTVRRIRADALHLGGESEEQGEVPAADPAVPPTEPADDGESGSGLAAVFDGNVELRESGVPPASSAPDDRLMRANRLEATLVEGLSRLADARFLGNVTLEAEGISAEADQATYAPDEALFTLDVADATGLTPRMDDERGFVQARTIAIDLDGPHIEATRDVKGVLSETQAAHATTTVRPGLFAEGAPIHLVAGRFSYDGEQSLATYDGRARLWQGSTEFRGQTIVIDETTGNITAEGSVQTRTTMLQQDAELESAVETETAGSGDTLFYDNRLHQATYATGALLSSQRSSLSSEKIELFLHEDARTLGRIEAAGTVALELDTRSVTADTLTYDDQEGRYDFTGFPVSVIERMEGECRETTGRSVTFHTTGESISADGQSAERTASTSGC